MKIKITFPFPVKQISCNEVEVESRPMEHELVNRRGVDEIAEGLSEADKEDIIVKTIETVQAEVIRRSMTVKLARY